MKREASASNELNSGAAPATVDEKADSLKFLPDFKPLYQQVWEGEAVKTLVSPETGPVIAQHLGTIHSGVSEEDNMHTLKRCALVAFFSAVSVYSQANEPIESITVSATPIAIDDAGSSISIISREDILRRNAPTVQALLREVPGFAVSQQGSEGAISQLRVRGAEANQVLVLINGIEANDPAQGSEFDFSQLTTHDIERIEIVRGPQSALWGSEAMAGVIHIITMPGAEVSGFEIGAEAGSFSTSRATLDARHAGSKHQVKFSANYLDSEGTNISRTGSEDDGLENITAGLSGRYQATDRVSLAYTARYTDRKAEFDGTDFFTTGLPTDTEYETESEYLYTGITLQHTLTDLFDHSLDISRADSDNETYDGNPQNSVTRATRDAIRYQLNMVGAANRLSLLLEHETEDYEQRGPIVFGDPNKDLDTETDSVAVEYRYDSEQFNLSASVRRDNNSEFDDATSWRLTGNTHIAGANLFASVGESIKNPSFTERFGFFNNFIGNPELKPEESFHWEIGVRKGFAENQINLALTYFDADLENEINGFVFDPVTFGFTSANVDGRSERSGIELELGYAPNSRFDMAMAYTYLDATQEDFTGNDVTEVRRPEHVASLTMNYTWPKAGINFVASYTGDQEDDYFPPFPPFQERVELGAYTLVSVSGYYNLNDTVTLTARMENMTDEDYEQVYGYESPGFGGYLGLRVSM